MIKPTLLRLACWPLLATSWLTGLSQPLPVRVTPPTQSTSTSPEIQPPTRRIVAAVYPFQVAAGQHTQARNPLQAALTDQYTSILFRSLESSGWFTPIEPGNIGSLLNGRPTAPVGHTGTQAENAPPPSRDKPAIVLEAGLFSHDVRSLPGEVGNQYLASNGNGHYRMDRTTVFLRALSAQSGKILTTVYWTKTLLSQPASNQVYRYVEINRLHGHAIGSTKMSPEQLVVGETIKDAVRGLIIEGVRDGLWTGGNLSARQATDVIRAYEVEKGGLADAQQVNMEPDRKTSRQQPAITPSLVSLSPYGGLLRYHGDYADWATNATYGLSADVYTNPYVGFQLNLASGTLSSQNAFRTNITSAEANLLIRVLPYHRLTPLVYGGVGVVSRSGSNPVNWTGKAYVQYQIGGGLQYSVSHSIGFRARLDYSLPNTDMLDGRKLGNHNDFYVRTTLGLLFHFGSDRPR